MQNNKITRFMSLRKNAKRKSREWKRNAYAEYYNEILVKHQQKKKKTTFGVRDKKSKNIWSERRKEKFPHKIPDWQKIILMKSKLLGVGRK